MPRRSPPFRRRLSGGCEARFCKMAPSSLSRLGRVVTRLTAQQNAKIAFLKSKKNLLEEKLNTRVKQQKMDEESQAAKIKLQGNRLLFKYMKHGLEC